MTTAWVSAGGRAPPEVQLSVYTHAYRARLIEVLANDYPAMRVAVGDKYFKQLGDQYIQSHPSHYFNLRDFGQHLPGFVANWLKLHPGYSDMLWLVELALFEWTLGEAFDAANPTLLTEQDIATIPPQSWPELKFTVHPSVYRLDLEWNIPEVWQALTANQPIPAKTLHATAGPWLVWREQLVTRFRSMQSDECYALDKVREGANFVDVCEVLGTLMNEEKVPMRAAGLLKGWIRQGVICGIR